MQKFALFDFDGTLIKGDSIVSFLWFNFIQGELGLKRFIKVGAIFVKYLLGFVPSIKAKEQALSFLKGKDEKQIAELVESWYQKKIFPKIFLEGIDTINKLKDKNYIVLLVTASPDFYLKPIIMDLGFKAIIGTHFLIDDQGRFTGEICGDNCRGIEKNFRIAQYLASKQMVLNPEDSYAFGNSKYDEAMLSLVKKPVLVNPSKSLKRAFPKGEVVRWKKARKNKAL